MTHKQSSPRLFTCAALAVAAALTYGSSAHAGVVTYDGNGTGATSMSTAVDWDTNSNPTATDQAVFTDASFGAPLVSFTNSATQTWGNAVWNSNSSATLNGSLVTLSGSAGNVNGDLITLGSRMTSGTLNWAFAGVSGFLTATTGNLNVTNVGATLNMNTQWEFNNTIANQVITKTGKGVLSFTNGNNGNLGSGANAKFVLDGGTINFNTNTGFGSFGGGGVTLEIHGGTFLDTNGAGFDMTLNKNNAEIWAGDFTFKGSTKNLNLGTGAVTITGATRQITVSALTLTVGGAIGDGSNGYGITKAGAGTLTLANANTYSGPTTINSGTLQENFSVIGTSLTNAPSNYINSSSTLVLGGGALVVAGRANGVTLSATTTAAYASGATTVVLNSSTGLVVGQAITLGSGSPAGEYIKSINSGTITLGIATTGSGSVGTTANTTATTVATSQTFASTTINAGVSTIAPTSTSGASGATTTVNLGAITRNQGGQLNLTLPTGVTVTTETANTATGILGGWVTVGGNDWATSAGSPGTPGAITAYSGYTTQNSATAFGTGGNTGDLVVTGALSGAVANGSAINSLKLNVAAPGTLTLSGSLTINSGGILLSNTVTTAPTITGGVLMGTSATGLNIFSNGSGAGATINSSIQDNGGATSLAFGGSGTWTLGGNNTYTGQTYINGGTLKISNNNQLGAVATGAALNINGGALTVTGSVALDNAGSNARNIVIGAKNATLANGAASDNLIILGTISGTGFGTLTFTGPGTLTLGGSNSYTGNTNIKTSAGTNGTSTVVLGNDFAFGTGTVSFGGGGTTTSKTTIQTDGAVGTTRTIANDLGSVGGNGVTLVFGTATTGNLSFTSNAPLNLGGAVRTFQIDNAITSFTGGFTGGAAGLTKTGTGSLVMNGDSTFTGATLVQNGILKVNGTLGATPVTVGNAATASLTPALAGGIGASNGGTLQALVGSATSQVYASNVNTGYIAGAVTISGTSASGSAGHLAPGNSVGTLTVGSLTLSGGSILDYEFNGTANDFTVVTGALTLNSGTVGVNLFQESGTNQFATIGTYDLFQYGSLTGSVSNLSVLNPNGSFNYAFGTATSGTSNYVTLTITSSGSGATPTTYTLTASAGSTNILTGGTTDITSTITNTGTGSADTLNYTGLGASSAAGGSVSGSTTSGTGLAQGASGTNAGQVFTGTQSGAVVVTPVGSGTNATAGGAATATGTTSVTVNVFDPASLSATQSGTGNLITVAALNASGTFRASAKVTVDNGLSNNQGFTDVAVTPGTQIDPGNSVTVASFDKTNRLNGTYTATKSLGYDNVTSSGSAITGGTGNTANVGISVTVSGQTAGAGQAFTATLFSGQKYGTTTGSTSSGYGLTSNIAGDPHNGTTATLINGTASANTTVSMSFNTVPSAGAIHDTAFRTSDILSLGGIVATGTLGPDNSILTDKYVLQLSYDPSAAGAQYIGWYDAVQSQWVNAIAGNSTGGHYDGTGEFAGSYAAYLATLTGPQQADLAFQLNAFGYDASTHTAWAVLDHNSEFAVIPEPSTWGMIFSGFGMLIGIQRLRRRRVGT